MTYLPSDYTKFIEAIAAFVTKVETSPFSDVSTSAYYYEGREVGAGKGGITGGIGNAALWAEPALHPHKSSPSVACRRFSVVNYAMNMSDVPIVFAPKYRRQIIYGKKQTGYRTDAQKAVRI